MQIKKFLLTGIFFALNLLGAYAQSGNSTITGKVKDESGRPIPGAIIKITGTNTAVAADENGLFKFERISSGKVTVTASAIGMKLQQKSVSISPEKPAELQFILLPSVQQLESVAINGRTVTQEVNRQAYNVTAIDAKKLHNTSLDIGQALDRVSGIRVKETGGLGSNMNISLNGFTGNQVKFFIDGLPMDNFGSSFQLNNIPINFAERIEVYKGVVPVWLGGDALGGAVNIITKSTPQTYLDASYSFGSFNTHKTNVNAGYTARSGFTAQLNAFQNYSDNNYWVNVDVADFESGVYTPMRVRRFHDNYHNETAILNLGVMNKKYADQLLVGITLGQNKADIQTGNRMEDVYGARLRKGNIIQPTFKYIKKDLFTKGLDVQLTGRYNLGEERSIDTAFRRYNWLGESSPKDKNPEAKGGESGERRDYRYKNNNGVFSGNISYVINEHHSINFNHITTTFNRKGFNALDPGNLADQQPQKTTKHVTGLGYRFDYNQKWSSTIFAKNYAQQSQASKLMDGVYSKGERSISEFGYGFATTYHLLSNLQLKASYEKARRLPENNELFGDIDLLSPNLDLLPESSNNLNIGARYHFSLNKNHQFSIDASYVHRDASDFIRWVLQPVSFDGKQNQKADNVRDVKNSSIEGEINYSYKNLFNAGFNITYQNLRNNTRYEPGKTEPSPTFGDRIPNMPYIFGNANASVVIPNIGKDKNSLTIGYNMLFVGKFYLRWPSNGSQSTKAEIPHQISHNANMVYTMAKGKYNLSLECFNLADKVLYDNYSLQRPSRSFALKVRYFFSKDLLK
ncbi:TonB-dependent receptor [Pedobacter caeni]|uniref:Outer membrane receptor proteins, mostly Fe transport n=1 Tax=Pedobacter caeni TaxID=288992 RepID=A0A1M5HAP7_9SPHI|nr:TonB-dependent receptor [Pedobacter caeni]SHG12948.1 Outer membrane receptor proteins, mostly Fe transport [Pedobacter caeni]